MQEWSDLILGYTLPLMQQFCVVSSPSRVRYTSTEQKILKDHALPIDIIARTFVEKSVCVPVSAMSTSKKTRNLYELTTDRRALLLYSKGKKNDATPIANLLKKIWNHTIFRPWKD